MLKQTLDKYRNILLGDGIGSIYNLGCYLVSLCDGLNRHGYNFTPESLNQILKDKGLWTGDTKNYINVDQLSKIWPEVFVSFKSIEPLITQDIPLDDSHIVLAKVNATPIGGSGSHFVEVLRMAENYAIIGDPWYGDEVRANDRYGKCGTLLGIRIFEIKRGNMPNVYKGLDLTNQDSMKVAVDVWDQVVNQKLYIKKSDSDMALQDQATALKTAQSTADAKQAIIEQLAAKLGSTADVADMLGAIDGLLSVEDQLNTAKKALDQQAIDNQNTVKDLQSQINQLLAQILDLKGQVKDLSAQALDLAKQVKAAKETTVQINWFTDIISKLQKVFKK